MEELVGEQNYWKSQKYFSQEKIFASFQGSVMELMGCNEDEGPYTLFLFSYLCNLTGRKHDSRFHSLKYQWSTTLSGRNVGIRKLYFYQINHFCLEFKGTFHFFG